VGVEPIAFPVLGPIRSGDRLSRQRSCCGDAVAGILLYPLGAASDGAAGIRTAAWDHSVFSKGATPNFPCNRNNFSTSTREFR